MRFINEYRDTENAKKLAYLINSQITQERYKIMEVCGTHTAAIRKFGIMSLLSKRIELISGPGCPVCVTSDGYLRRALTLSQRGRITLATYPDMLRVPVDGTSLEEERARGADIRSVNSALETLDLAKRAGNREVIFLAVGFETTAPGTAIAVRMAKKEKIKNLSIYSAHKTIPEALWVLGKDKDLAISGFLLPGHVSAIIGVSGYRPVIKKIGIPSVISGFESLDILLSLYKIIKAVNSKKIILENEYKRVVTAGGNRKAQHLLSAVFEKRDGFWRGLGAISRSALVLKKEYRQWDAEIKFDLKRVNVSEDSKLSCRCAEVLKGKIKPLQCPYFAKKCTPQTPQGPCMVSHEGTCRTFFEYR
jgi:hydrogenase expression/formation protein HypD